MQGSITSVSIKHNFETAHRLPFLGGKCQNLHGHSWKVKVALTNTAYPTGVNAHGVSIEYGLAKSVIRSWIDTHLDHGVMLGAQDLLVHSAEVRGLLGKVFIFGDHADSGYFDKPWPTVEAVAEMLGVRLQQSLTDVCGPYLKVNAISVQETETNEAYFMPPVPDDPEDVEFAEFLGKVDPEAAH